MLSASVTSLLVKTLLHCQQTPCEASWETFVSTRVAVLAKVWKVTEALLISKESSLPETKSAWRSGSLKCLSLSTEFTFEVEGLSLTMTLMCALAQISSGWTANRPICKYLWFLFVYSKGWMAFPVHSTCAWYCELWGAKHHLPYFPVFFSRFRSPFFTQRVHWLLLCKMLKAHWLRS